MAHAPLRAALADDFLTLARLHGAELDASSLEILKEAEFPCHLAVLPAPSLVNALQQAIESAAQVLQKNDESTTRGSLLDLLAADYAAIYLTNAYSASPYESVWLHDEHLACQQPMFDLRELYAAAGWRVDDWRKRYDDHFVLQFQYLAYCLQQDAESVPLAHLGDFMDTHVGFWFPDFVMRVAQRADTPFYLALVVFTGAWLERVRQIIEEVSGVERTPRELMAQKIKERFVAANVSVAPLKFMPGAAGPSW